jgi:hypothetical protein
MQLWFGASNQTYVISARNFRRGSSIQSVSMVCRAIRRNSFCPEKLAEYGEVIRVRTANLPPREAGYVRLTFVGLQQRLLSSIAAFAKTLEVHRKGVLRADVAGSEAVAEEFVRGGAGTEDEPIDELGGEKLIQEEEDQAAEAAGAIAASVSDLTLVDEMLEIATPRVKRCGSRISTICRRTTELRMADKAGEGAPRAAAVLSSQRLKLQTSYGQAMIHARGYSAPETTAAFARAR